MSDSDMSDSDMSDADMSDKDFSGERGPEELVLGEKLLKVIEEAGSEAAMDFYAQAHEEGYKGAAEDVAQLVENTLLSEHKAPEEKGAEAVISQVFEASVLGSMSKEDATESLSASVSKTDLVGAIQHMLDEYVAKENVKGLLGALKEQGNVPIRGIKEVLHEQLKHEESEGDYIVTLRSWGVESFLVKEEDADSPQEAAQIAENGRAYTYGLWPYHKRPEETYVVEIVGGETCSVDPGKIEPQKTKQD